MKFFLILTLIFVVPFCGCGVGTPVSYQSVTWKQLGAFAYRPSVTPRQKASPTATPIPPSILALNGQKLRISGYMMPIEVEGEAVRTFVLVRDQQLCCFGRMPNLNEWVMVAMASGTTEMNMDEPIEVEGSFHVGEQIEDGAVLSLYRLTAKTVRRSEGKAKGWIAN